MPCSSTMRTVWRCPATLRHSNLHAVTRRMSLWASTTAPKVQLDAADVDEAEPVRAGFRERVSSPCGEDGEVESAGHPLGGGGCAALFPSLHFVDQFSVSHL